MARQHYYAIEMFWKDGTGDGDTRRKFTSAMKLARGAFKQDPAPVRVIVSRVQNDDSRGKRVLTCTRQGKDIRCARR